MTLKYLLFQFCLLNSCLYAHFYPREYLWDSEEVCVVFVCNKQYFSCFLDTVTALTTIGNYHGDICLIIGNDLLDDDLLNNPTLLNNNVQVKYFPDLQFPHDVFEIASTGLTFPYKRFQYHKFYVFNTYFKKWKTILYLDSGMQIYADIHKIIDIRQPNKLLAHSDAFPTYSWKLADQFNYNQKTIYNKLRNNFNLDIDYFQTTMMLFDTNIIQDNTFQDLYNLTLEYPISNTNDQGIMALYFTNIVPAWEQIPTRDEETFFYDFMKRTNQKYIMTKR